MKPLRESITAEQAENIEILAKFLIRGKLSGQFTMLICTSPGAYMQNAHICGTVGCALGYAPEALGTDRLRADLYYDRYRHRHGIYNIYNFSQISEELLGISTDSYDFDYAFAPWWASRGSGNRTTPFAAGQRLLYLLNTGLPDTWREEMGGTARQSWEVNPYTLLAWVYK